jgi:hypothetical protein
MIRTRSATCRSGPYLVRGYFDSNRDGQVNIETGDAIGGYGANIDQGDLELEFIGIGEGDHVTGIDFQMYDPAAASGYTSYSGTAFDSYRDVYVGFFISASDAALLQNPIFVEDDYWVPGKQHDEYPDWVFNQVFQGFADGTYYVAAFLDGDGNFVYDPATDPAGVYGGAATPTALVMTKRQGLPGHHDCDVGSVPSGARGRACHDRRKMAGSRKEPRIPAVRGCVCEGECHFYRFTK